MKTLLFAFVAGLLITAALAELPPVMPKKISTTADFRQLLLTTKWSWRNPVGNVPDRECVFMPDGTFRHPHFVAKFTIKDINTVELSKPKEKSPAILTFAADYMSFEGLDFDKERRVSGKRLP